MVLDRELIQFLSNMIRQNILIVSYYIPSPNLWESETPSILISDKPTFTSSNIPSRRPSEFQSDLPTLMPSNIESVEDTVVKILSHYLLLIFNISKSHSFAPSKYNPNNQGELYSRLTSIESIVITSVMP